MKIHPRRLWMPAAVQGSRFYWTASYNHLYHTSPFDQPSDDDNDSAAQRLHNDTGF